MTVSTNGRSTPLNTGGSWRSLMMPTGTRIIPARRFTDRCSRKSIKACSSSSSPASSKPLHEGVLEFQFAHEPDAGREAVIEQQHEAMEVQCRVRALLVVEMEVHVARDRTRLRAVVFGTRGLGRRRGRASDEGQREQNPGACGEDPVKCLSHRIIFFDYSKHGSLFQATVTVKSCAVGCQRAVGVRHRMPHRECSCYRQTASRSGRASAATSQGLWLVPGDGLVGAVRPAADTRGEQSRRPGLRRVRQRLHRRVSRLAVGRRGRASLRLSSTSVFAYRLRREAASTLSARTVSTRPRSSAQRLVDPLLLHPPLRRCPRNRITPISRRSRLERWA